MPEVQYEVFGVQTHGSRGMAHGRAALEAVAGVGAVASFGRMIELGAHAEFGITGDARGGIDAGLAAEIEAGGEVAVSAALRAGLPIDLFTDAGIVARAALEARAAAWVRADLALDFVAFAGTLTGHARARLGAPWDQLIGVFIQPDTFQVSAGVFAHVAVAAQAYAEASLAGSLASRRQEPPGFTFKLDYGVGWGYGTGYSFIANFSLPDPAALLDRLGDGVVDVLRFPLADLVERLPANDRDGARAALPLVDLVVPLAMRSAFELGGRLVDPTATRADAEKAVLRTVLKELQESVAIAFVHAARQELEGILSRNEVRNVLDALAGDAADALVDARERLAQLTPGLLRLPSSDRMWPIAAEKLLRALADIYPLVPAPANDDYRHALALTWCAVAVVQQVSRWTTAADAVNDAQGPIIPAPPPFIAAHIADGVGRPQQSPTMISAIEFMVRQGPPQVAALAQHRPEIEFLLGFAEEALAPANVAEPLSALFGGGLPLDDAAMVGALVEAVADALRARVKNELMPRLLVPLSQEAEAAGDAGMKLLLDRVVAPTVLGLTDSLLTVETFERLQTEGGALLVREQVSSLLMQALGRLLLTTANHLADIAVDQAVPQLKAVATEIENDEGVLAATAAISTIAAFSGVGLLLTPHPGDIAGMLRLAAETMRLWSDGADGHPAPREVWFARMDELLALGLADTQSIRALWAQLADRRRDPPNAQDLTAFLGDALRDDALWLALKVASRLLELLVKHFTWLAEQAAKWLRDAVEKAVEVLSKAMAELDREVMELAKQAGRLLGEAAAAAQELAGQIAALANDLRNERSVGHARLRQRARDGLEWEIRNNWLLDPDRNHAWWLVPGPFRDDVRNGLVAIADASIEGAFWAASHTIDAPLMALGDAARWLQDRLRNMGAGPPVTREQLQGELREQIRRFINAQDFWVGIRVPLRAYWDPPDLQTLLGPVAIGPFSADLGVLEVGFTVPYGTVVQTIIDVVVDSLPVRATLELIASAHNTMHERTHLASITHAARDQLIAREEDASKIKDALVVPTHSQIRIGGIADNDTVAKSMRLEIEVTNVNETYFAPQFGVPKRVQVFINGGEFAYGDSWGRTAGGYMLRLELSVRDEAKLPGLVMPVGWRPLQLPDGWLLTRPQPGQLAELVDLDLVPADRLRALEALPARPIPFQPFFSPVPQLKRRLPAEDADGGRVVPPEVIKHILDGRNVFQRDRIPTPRRLREGVVVRPERIGGVRGDRSVPPPADAALIKKLQDAPRASAFVMVRQAPVEPRTDIERTSGVRWAPIEFWEAVMGLAGGQVDPMQELWKATGGRLENYNVPAGRVTVSVVVDDQPPVTKLLTFFLTRPA